VKFPVAVSNERSVPRATTLLPTTPEKLTMGLAVNPRLVLIPAYSCWYWSSTCYHEQLNRIIVAKDLINTGIALNTERSSKGTRQA